MPRVLHCIWRMGLGGAERQLIFLSEGLRKRGVSVHVATAFDAVNDDSLLAAGVELHRLRASGKYDPRVAVRLGRVIRSIQPDLVQTWLTQMDIVAGLGMVASRRPWVLSERSVAAAYPASPVHRLRAFAGARADAVIANSEGGAAYWRLQKRDLRVCVIPNIVPMAEIDAARPAEGIEGPVVLFVGRMGPEKNVANLIRGLAKVKGEPFTAILCGEGVLRSGLRDLAESLGIGERTRFPGAVPEPWSWMKRANVVVAVSLFEGNPNVVLEAMAAGTPLVVSDIDAHRTLIPADAALFVDPASPEAIGKAMVETIRDPVRAKGRADRARAVVEGRSADQIAELYLDVYEDLIARRRD